MLKQQQVQKQQQRIDPKIIQANAMLQLSAHELEETLQRELEDNPALELEEGDPCAECELAPYSCAACQYNKTKNEIKFTFAESDETQYMYGFPADSDDEDDPLDHVRADMTLHEHLREQLRNSVTGRMFYLADYLINYIDEHGYLSCDLLEIHLELEATDEELAEAVSIIQTLDPPGVGACDLRECMLIQLHYLAEEGRGSLITERIVRDCWNDIAGNRPERIARKLKIKPETVQRALNFIQKKLSPYPAAGFRAPWDYKPIKGVTSIRPDVIIRRTQTGYDVEIVAGDTLSLAINPQYRQMRAELSGLRGQKLDDDKKRLIEYVDRAELLIKNVNRRRKTLRKITKYIIECQHGFLSTGLNAFLKPLTRIKVAEAIGMHESTVSRAIMNKYVQLPSQEVVAFDFFFQSAPSKMEMVMQLMKNEDTSRPLSDQEIAEIMAQKGYPIARRTVAKYRGNLKILSSRQRRR